MKQSCCKRYRRRGRACGSCPKFAGLSIKQIKKLRKKAKR